MDLVWETAPGLGARKYGDLEGARGGIILRTFLLQPHPLDRAEEMCCSPRYLHQRTKLSIGLSRASLMWRLYERSVDKRRTLIQAKSKSTQVAQKIFLSSSNANPSGPSMFSMTRPGRGIRC
jgi:hypothetical protein